MQDPNYAESRWLSYLLRHNPQSIGRGLDPEGWLAIDDLVATGRVTHVQVLEIVADNKKERFELDVSKESIRARYGHSVDVTRQYPLAGEDVLYHGTQRRFLGAILEAGLLPMTRKYVHLTSDTGMADVVGSRRGKDTVLLTIDAAAMRRDGLLLYDAGRAVVLCTWVEPKYLTLPV